MLSVEKPDFGATQLSWRLVSQAHTHEIDDIRGKGKTRKSKCSQ